MITHDDNFCPSYRCKAGAVLLGIVQADGKVSFATEKIMVDHDFVDIANLGRTPERRFRFAGKCVERGCNHWGEGRCGAIDRILTILKPTDTGEELPSCSIRSQCRWFNQVGAKACFACPEVISDRIFPEKIISVND